jgi:hypothetical protein
MRAVLRRLSRIRGIMRAKRLMARRRRRVLRGIIGIVRLGRQAQGMTPLIHQRPAILIILLVVMGWWMVKVGRRSVAG